MGRRAYADSSRDTVLQLSNNVWMSSLGWHQNGIPQSECTRNRVLNAIVENSLRRLLVTFLNSVLAQRQLWKYTKPPQKASSVVSLASTRSRGWLIWHAQSFKTSLSRQRCCTEMQNTCLFLTSRLILW